MSNAEKGGNGESGGNNQATGWDSLRSPYYTEETPDTSVFDDPVADGIEFTSSNAQTTPDVPDFSVFDAPSTDASTFSGSDDMSWYDGSFIELDSQWKAEVAEEKRKDEERAMAERLDELEAVRKKNAFDFELLADAAGGNLKYLYDSCTDEQRQRLQASVDLVFAPVSVAMNDTNSTKRIESLHCFQEAVSTYLKEKAHGAISDEVENKITKFMQGAMDTLSEKYPDDGEIRIGNNETQESDSNLGKDVRVKADTLSNAILAAVVDGNAEAIGAVTDTVELLKSSLGDSIERGDETKSSIWMNYCSVHGADKGRANAFLENVVAAIDAGDPEVDCLIKKSNSYSSRLDTFGIADFTTHMLVSQINPTNIQELLLAQREIPTSDYAAFEQNRKDACELCHAIIRRRDFIHDELPGVHELLAAMLKFYDTKDDAEAHQKANEELHRIYERKTEQDAAFYDASDSIFDLGNYEKITERKGRSIDEGSGIYEPAVEALRRLVENTDPKTLEKPETGDQELDSMINGMLLKTNEVTGEAYVDFRQVGGITKRMNEILKEHMGESGMHSSMLKSIAFVERVATFALRGVTEKDRHELLFDPNFKEMCRFAELTSQSREYSESDFEGFWSKVQRVKNFDDVNEINTRFQMLAHRRLSQLRDLPHKTKFLRREAGALWSGNLNHEIIGLVDARKY
ncbi:MAG: hypothetical protein MJ154_00350 [Candidatus Saccharibacteria bacterium]|nr:hypothetical protein [Candidatus Saccharibacteria bacterium]